jgi:hypothetical protein
MPNKFKSLNYGHNFSTGEVIPMYSDIAAKYLLLKPHELGAGNIW